MTRLVKKALELADSQIGVREHGRNRGPHVDLYIRAAGLDPNMGSYPWCAAFVTWCFREAAKELGLTPIWPRNASALKTLDRMSQCLTAVPTPGSVFVMDAGKGKGHTGFVELLSPAGLVTIEGNTNPGGSREGDGVYRRTRRIDECVGFIDVSILGEAAK